MSPDMSPVATNTESWLKPAQVTESLCPKGGREQKVLEGMWLLAWGAGGAPVLLTCALEQQLPVAQAPHEGFVVLPTRHRQRVGLGVEAHAEDRSFREEQRDRGGLQGRLVGPPRTSSL